MTQKFDYDKFSFNLAGRYFEGKQVVHGIALGLLATSVYGFRRFLQGGWCYINKDLTGKNVVITGGNGGIGKETAKRLVELGATVIIGSRDQNKNKQTVQELTKIGKGKIISFQLDLGDRTSIQNFVDNVKRRLVGQPLHYLLNNAGVMAIRQRTLTKDNMEMQIGTNHFGHFYLTYLLWDKLKSSGNPRIVNVSGLAHTSLNKNFDLDFNNMHFQNGGYNSIAAYSRSKKANILFTKELQRRMQKAKINGTSVSLHPGIIKTGLQRYVLCNWWRKLLAFIISPIYLFLLKTSTQGAQTSLFCLLEDDNSIIKGGHYSDCKITKTSSSQVQDLLCASRLWQLSQKAYGIKFNL